MIATEGSFVLDCLPCVNTWQGGKTKALGAKSKYADTWAALFSAVEEDPGEPIPFGSYSKIARERGLKWVPSHCGPDDVPLLISEEDRVGNALADHHAQEVASAHKASEAVEAKYAKAIEEIITRARGRG